VKPTLTLGVIGHVDHGKTALVRALTGTETDRLREERERGLSIVLGFAFLETDESSIDLIDVPGHEDFIRAMISGATGLDGVMLCVAANEGVMPQTVEHFNIARLLGIGRGLVVITKCDLVDAETLALARGEIDAFCRDSFLADAPVIEVSALAGAGVDEIRAQLLAMARAPVERDDGGRVFLPLDRVFAMRGFGLVGTGTLRGGSLAVGDTVDIVPAGLSATVRALQNHNLDVERAWPGQRVAVNLRQVSREQVARGDVLATPGYLTPTRCIDADLQLLDDARVLKNGAVLRLATGTTEAMARLSLLDRRELAPGDRALAQFHLDREVATRVAEPFLLRSVSPIHTIGGGRILEAHPERHRRFDATVTRRLETVASGRLDRMLQQRLDDAGSSGLDPAKLADELGVDRPGLERALDELEPRRVGTERVVAAAAYAQLLDDIVGVLRQFHEQQPLAAGLVSSRLSQALPSVPDAPVLRHALAELVERGLVVSRQETLSLAGHDAFARLSADERRLVGAIEAAFRNFGLEPPAPGAVIGTGRASRQLFELLLESGRLIRLRTYKSEADLVLHASVLEQARQTIEQAFPYPSAFALKDIRDLLGSTRRFVVPLMEHFDATGTTVRSGDLRRLRA